MSNLSQDNYKFISQHIVTETGELPRAEVVFSENGIEHRAVSTGSGPVDAIF